MLLGLLFLAGCSGSANTTNESSAATATATLAPTATMPATPIPLSQPPLSMKAAWGNVQISQFSLDIGTMVFMPTEEDNGVTSDGQLCGTLGPQNTANIDWSHTVEDIALVSLITGKITSLAALPPGYSTWGCSVTGSWYIWTQVSGNSFGSWANTWILKALNRSTGQIITLDKARQSSAQNQYAAIRPYPYADNGRVVWTTYSSDLPRGTQSEMYTFATGTKTVLADGTSYPMLSWPWVAWGDSQQKAIVCKNLETQQQILLNMPYAPTTAAFNGTTFVYTHSPYAG